MLLEPISLLKDGFRGALSLLFPSRCAGCDKIDAPILCMECVNALERIGETAVCLRCGEPESSGNRFHTKCRNCREASPDYCQARSAYIYSGPLSGAITQWKYRGAEDAGNFLSALLVDWIASHAPKWWEETDVLIPVPHHPETIKSRGFSPPEQMSLIIGRYFNKPVLPRIIFKTIQTASQMSLDSNHRMSNISGSMRIFDDSLIEGKSCVIIDDVMTTGATLNECAKILKKAGAAGIYGLTLARQSAYITRH